MSAPHVCASALLVALCGCKKDPDNGTGQPTSAQERTTDPAAAPLGPPPAVNPTLGPTEVALEEIASGLVAPTDLVTAPDGTMVVLDQPGTMHLLEGGELQEFGDIRDRVVPLEEDYDERGLLGMAFHPKYPEDARVFVYYSAPLRKKGSKRGYNHTNVLSEFRVVESRIDADSERELLALDWPAPNHDGGTVMFGPDRMLYFSMGDGGLAADRGKGHPPMGNGQDFTTLMGSILRIDPDPSEDEPYGIPPGNPFAGEHEGADEIWAYGLRNVYAFAFDSKTGMLIAGDVGQDLYEEVNVIERGKNYGWSVREGPSCLNPDETTEPREECPDVGKHGEPLVDPVLWYAQPDRPVSSSSKVHGISVIGGEVYRGTAIPELDGMYVFGDWSLANDRAEGMLLVARPEGDEWAVDRLPVKGISTVHIGRYLRGFGSDRAGELYVLTSDRKGTTGETGIIWRLAPADR